MWKVWQMKKVVWLIEAELWKEFCLQLVSSWFVMVSSWFMILVSDTEGLWKLPMQHYAQMRTKIAEHRCLLDKEIHRSPTQLHDDLQKRSVNHNFKIDLQFSHVLSNVLQCSKLYVRCDWSVTITPNSTRHNSRFCTSIGCASLVSPVLNSAVTMQFYSWSPR